MLMRVGDGAAAVDIQCNAVGQQPQQRFQLVTGLSAITQSFFYNPFI